MTRAPLIQRADPFTLFPIWHSADYTPDPDPAPLYAHQHAELLAQCRTALARRRTTYPALIARDTITPQLAAQDIAAWEALTAEWLWIISGTGQPPARHTLPDRIAAVDLAKVRVDQELDRGNNGYDILRQSHLIAALHWHLMTANQPPNHGEPMIWRCARFNHDMRAANLARWCATCERWNHDPAAAQCPTCPQPKEMAA